MKGLFAIASLGLLVLGGCSSLQIGALPSPPPASAAVSGDDEDGVVLAALPDPGLPKGSCGMVLWTLDDDRPAPIFRHVAGKGAEIVVRGETIALKLVEANGAAAFGVYEEQVFRNDAGLEARVSARFSLGFDGGSYLERGLVAVTSPDGWRTVSPTAGIAGCRAK